MLARFPLPFRWPLFFLYFLHFYSSLTPSYSCTSPPDHSWLRWSRASLLFALDFSSFSNFDESDEPFDNLPYTVFMIFLPIIFVSFFYVVNVLVFERYNTGRRIIRAVTFQKIAVLVAEFLYIPISIAFVRLYVCDISDKVIYVSSSLECYAAPHIVLILLSLVFVLPFLVLVPLLLRQFSSKATIFSDMILHEKYLRSREIEYLIGVNNYYDMDAFYLLSSYNRSWSHYKSWVCLQKIVLVAIVHLGGEHTAKEDSLELQAFCFTFVLGVTIVTRTFVDQYRCISTNKQAQILEW